MDLKAQAIWLRRWVWPLLAVIIFVFEMFAIFNADPGDTITEWISDFPILLWIPAMILFIWLPLHLWQWRKRRDES